MHQRSPQVDRNAITLIEVLLVLAVLVMLAAVTWPAMDRPMTDQRLRKAADKVRTAWAKARVDAMSSGNSFVFRCTLESGEFTVESQAGVESVASMTSSTPGQFDETVVETTEPLSSKTRQLPLDIRIVDGEVDFDTRATILLNTTEDASDDMVGECLDPILFFPDGTTSTATLILESKHQRRIEVSIRGLTGVITVGSTYPAEDLTNARQ